MATASSLSFSSTTMRSAVFRPTPGILVRRARSPVRMAGTSSSTFMPERIFSARDGQGVFAHVGVDQQSDLGVEITECSKSGERHGDQIADAADVENDLIGS